jgi:hypothetical protein
MRWSPPGDQLDAELATSVRTAASEQGISVSTWLADAAQEIIALARSSGKNLMVTRI